MMANKYPTLSPSNFTTYGIARRTHGHQGELVISLEQPEYEELQPQFLFPVIDNIPIPYRVEGFRGRYDQWIVKLQSLQNLSDAERLVGCTLLILGDETPKELQTDSHSLLSYSLLNNKGKFVGTISDIDDSTANILLLIKLADEGKEVPIPLVDEWLIAIDHTTQEITLNFPEELLEL